MTGVDLTAIDGLEVLTKQTIISEVDTDMSKWKSVKHFGSSVESVHIDNRSNKVR